VSRGRSSDISVKEEGKFQGKGVKPKLLILLQNPRSRNRENLRKIVPGGVGARNNLKIFLKVEKPASSAFLSA
jgi:hypothetical protein